jgi:multidrug resistance efflux pump
VSLYQSAAQISTANFVVAAPGQVERAGNVFRIGTAATGIVTALLVQEGAHVESGQLLAQIDCASIQKELDARTSSLAAIEAVLARVKEGARAEEIAIAVANVGLAEARAEDAQIFLQRIQASGGITITEAQLDQAKRDARIAAAQLDEARARLHLVRAGSRQEDIVEAQSRRNAAKSLVDEVAARLNYCSVRAPVGGIVLSTYVTAGQFVSATVPVTLVRMIDSTTRNVRAEVDERDLAKMCINQRALVTAESFPGAQIHAITKRINEGTSRRTMFNGTQADRSDRYVREVVLSLTDDNPNWPIGLRVRVEFTECRVDQRGEVE